MSMPDSTLHLGDCLDILPTISDKSIDCIICDPPYPEISRPYGRMTEDEWHAMMRGVVAESRRILKPSGSAVFILQANQEKAGRLRPWLFEFQAWTAREWNVVQDAYWWNYQCLPTAMANGHGGMRASLKHCVWLGEADCWRDQSAVLLPVAPHPDNEKRIDRHRLTSRVGTGMSVRKAGMQGPESAASRRGGVTPYNVIVCGAPSPGSNHGHGAQTPHEVCDWWVRYISPPGGVVCDPFMGSGTVGLAALKRGRRFVGIERDEGYFATASARIAEHQASTPLLGGVTA